jgi:hypothetical protein
MSDPNYMESSPRRTRRLAVRYGVPTLGALAGYAGGAKLKQNRVIGALLGAGIGEMGARPATRALDKRDLRRAGFNPHSSSMILGSRYAPEGSYVKFNTGKVYRYGDVTKDELQQLAEAESVGSHFNRNLRKRKYERLGEV